jgi:hypothetical protein
MPAIKVSANLNEVSTEFPILPINQEYLCQYDNPELGEGKTSGKPVLKTRMRIMQPSTVEVDGKTIKTEKLSFIESISLDPNAPYTLKARLIGAKVPFTVESGVTQFNSEDFAGRQVWVRAGVQERDGKKYNTVEATKPV